MWRARWRGNWYRGIPLRRSWSKSARRPARFGLHECAGPFSARRAIVAILGRSFWWAARLRGSRLLLLLRRNAPDQGDSARAGQFQDAVGPHQFDERVDLSFLPG